MRSQPIFWSQNSAARCKASSNLPSRSCCLASIDRSTGTFGETPPPLSWLRVPALQSPRWDRDARRPLRAMVIPRLAKPARPREVLPCDRSLRIGNAVRAAHSVRSPPPCGGGLGGGGRSWLTRLNNNYPPPQPSPTRGEGARNFLAAPAPVAS